MTTFDVAEVRDFAADLGARMDRCDNGEGMQCANLDGALRHYALLCHEFSENVRRWGREVFAGRVAFDPEVEPVWRTEAVRLYARAMALCAAGQQAGTEGMCYVLDGQAALGAALWELYPLAYRWVTPELAVGPSARQGLPLEPAAAEEVRRRIASLPPLPADWQPDNERLQKWLRKLPGAVPPRPGGQEGQAAGNALRHLTAAQSPPGRLAR
jgi:hypothetical protein